MFLRFFLPLIISDLLCPTVFSLWLMPAMLPMMALGRLQAGRTVAALLITVSSIAAVWQLYFWGTWAAWCASIAFHFVQDAGHGWIYYPLAFCFCQGPLAYLTTAELRAKQTAEEVRGLNYGSCLYSLFTGIAFIVVSVWPGLIWYVFWWVGRHW